MRRALELAREGHGQIVAAMGEAGVGKSRLFFEFKAVAQDGCLVLEAYSVSHGKASAYLPVIELLRELFQGQPGRRPAPAARKGNRQGAGARSFPGRHLALRFCVAWMSRKATIRWPRWMRRFGGGARRRRSSGFCCARASISPLILVFEDLHWIDERDPGAAQPAGRIDCQCAHPPAGELPARIPP